MRALCQNGNNTETSGLSLDLAFKTNKHNGIISVFSVGCARTQSAQIIYTRKHANNIMIILFMMIGGLGWWGCIATSKQHKLRCAKRMRMFNARATVGE